MKMTNPALDATADLNRLKQLVQRHQVCSESYPLTLKITGGLRQVGFELDLLGTHDHPREPVTPGCSECRAVYRALVEIAHEILPHERRETRHDVEPYEVALSFSSKRRFRNDVRLTIRIVHRDGFDLPIDPCEIRCLKEMKEKLKELGVHQDR